MIGRPLGKYPIADFTGRRSTGQRRALGDEHGRNRTAGEPIHDYRRELPAQINGRAFSLRTSKDSRDRSPEVYNEAIIPGFRAMKPAPKLAIARFGAGVHTFWKRRNTYRHASCRR
jgi:hypothetical protein